MKETMEEMRERLKREKAEAKVKPPVNLSAEPTDLATIAEELEARKQEESKGENQGFVKDTLYIEENIYKAFNALCIKRGDKKKYVNQALAEFVEREYKKLKK